MKYRIENVYIPESAGIARPADPNDQSQDLAGRRIIHVLDVAPDQQRGVRARVLTEEAD